MGKSYILKSLSLDYCLNNDLTLVTFESEEKSNVNYLLICRIIIFLQYGNIFWDYKPEKSKISAIQIVILILKQIKNIK